MLFFKTIRLSLSLCTLYAANGAESEKAIVTEVSRQFISTGTTESGQIDSAGNYSGNSNRTGYRVLAYTLRFERRVAVIHFDPRSTAEKIYPLAGIFTKGKDPEIRVGDTVYLTSRKGNKAQLSIDGKLFTGWIIKEKLMPLPVESKPLDKMAQGTIPVGRVPEEMKTVPSGKFLEDQLQKWTFDDAQRVMGVPIRQRQSFGKDKVVNGNIYAYFDPTGRYREFELDFDASTKKLVTVYLYPWNMTWDQCKEAWGENADLETRADGTQMHFYKERRLLVNTQKDGRVINFAVY